MNRPARLVFLVTLVSMLVGLFAFPAFAVHGQVPCGQYPPNPNCPSQSRGHRGGAPGLDGRTVGQGGPGPHGSAAASESSSATSGPGNSENAPGHTGNTPGQSGTAGKSGQANGHTSTTIPGVLTPGGLLLIGGFALTLMVLRRRNRRALIG
jgi:hypothetical protein